MQACSKAATQGSPSKKQTRGSLVVFNYYAYFLIQQLYLLKQYSGDLNCKIVRYSDHVDLFVACHWFVIQMPVP